jgi:hypothetical protein
MNAPRTAAFVRILRSFAGFAAQDDTRLRRSHAYAVVFLNRTTANVMIRTV